MGICSTPTKQESMKTLQKNTYKNSSKKKINGKFQIDTSFITK
jgi:hypothetical protein